MADATVEERKIDQKTAKRKKLKEFLEWLHHAYWIREFLLSSGVWTAATTWAVRQTYLASPYRWPITVALVGVSMFLFRLVAPLRSKEKKDPNQPQGSSSSLVIKPTESTLSAGIDIKEFFRTAYRTPVEADVRKNFYLLARQEQPHEPENFYLDFLGVGFLAAAYDNIWWPMYRSQLLALMEINRNSGMQTLSGVKHFYDSAVRDYAKEYKTDNFERWLSYLIRNQLIIRHQSDMIEITVKGKDFLKYLTHWGRGPESKRL